MTPEEPNNPFSWRSEIGANPTPKQPTPTPPPVDRYTKILSEMKTASRKRKLPNEKESSALGDFFMLMLGIPPRSILQMMFVLRLMQLRNYLLKVVLLHLEIRCRT